MGRGLARGVAPVDGEERETLPWGTTREKERDRVGVGIAESRKGGREGRVVVGFGV